jgi:hypothetical protein
MTLKLRSVILAASSLLLASSTFAQTNWGSTGAITVALTLSYQEEALQMKDETGKVMPIQDGGGPTYQNTFSKVTTTLVDGEPFPVKMVNTDEFGSKISTWKYGNKEIIEMLVESGLLPQIGRAPHIAGWSLIMTYDQNGDRVGAVARHTSKVTVPIEIGFSVDFAINATSSKTIVTDNTPPTGEMTSTETRSHASTFKGQATMGLPSYDGSPFNLTGLVTGGSKVTPKTEGSGMDRITTFVYSPTPTKIDKILGMSGMEELIEGSISIASGVIVDIDAFNAQP